MQKQKTSKTQELRDILPGVDKVSRMRNGHFKIYKGFFYTHGRSEEDFATSVMRKLENATLIDYGMVWKDFKGGAPVERQSHWWVIVKLNK